MSDSINLFNLDSDEILELNKEALYNQSFSETACRWPNAPTADQLQVKLKPKYQWLIDELIASVDRGCGIILAGGSICRFLANSFDRSTEYDLDLFLWGFTTQIEADNYVARLKHTIINQGYSPHEMRKVIQFDHPELTTIQLMLRSLPLPIQIVGYFDLLVSQVWFDGSEIHVSAPAAWCFYHKILLVDTLRFSRNTSVRLKKYHQQILPKFSLIFHSSIMNMLDNPRSLMVDLHELSCDRQLPLEAEYVNDLPDDNLTANESQLLAQQTLDMIGPTNASSPFGLFIKHALVQYNNDIHTSASEMFQKVKEIGSLFSYICYVWQTSSSETKALYVEMSRLVKQRKIEQLCSDTIAKRAQLSKLKKTASRDKRLEINEEIRENEWLAKQQIIKTIKDQMYLELRDAAKSLRKLRKFDQGDRMVTDEVYRHLLANHPASLISEWAESRLTLQQFLYLQMGKKLNLSTEPPRLFDHQTAESKLDLLINTELFFWFPDLNMILQKTVGTHLDQFDLTVIPLGLKLDLGMSGNWVEKVDSNSNLFSSKLIPETSKLNPLPDRNRWQKNWRNLLIATLQSTDFTDPAQLNQFNWDLHLNDNGHPKCLDIDLACAIHHFKGQTQLPYTKLFQILGVKQPFDYDQVVREEQFLKTHDQGLFKENLSTRFYNRPTFSCCSRQVAHRTACFLTHLLHNINLINQHIAQGHLIREYGVDLIDVTKPENCIWGWRPVDPIDAAKHMVGRDTLSEILLLYSSTFVTSDNYYKIIHEAKATSDTLEESVPTIYDRVADCRGTPFGDFVYEHLDQTIVPYLMTQRLDQNQAFSLIFSLFSSLPFDQLKVYLDRYPDKPSGLIRHYW